MGLGVHLAEDGHLHAFLLQVLFHQVGIPELNHDFVRHQEDLLSAELFRLFSHLVDGMESEKNAVGGKNARSLEDKLPFQMRGNLIIQICFRHVKSPFWIRVSYPSGVELEVRILFLG